MGNGDGTFKPYQRADQTVSLAEGDFGSNGQPEYVLSNTSIDQLSIQYGDTQSFVQGRDQGLQAPGAVAVADLNGDGNPDIIVVNKGENDILVYLGLGGNNFEAPLTFYTGTDPVGLTIANLTGNGIPDLIVANSGSNDLSIFLGEGRGANWTLVPGPRLRVGDDPVSTTVADVDGSALPDIICVDQGSNNVVVLPEVGGGFFDDSDPLTFSTGLSPIVAFVGRFDDGPGPSLAVLDSGSNDLTYYSYFLGGKSSPKFIPTGGVDPIAGVMVDYNDDGYNDLIIANNANNLITLFEGGPDGLVLTNLEFLSPSVHPTDLVYSGVTSGQLDLDISAEGRDQVISITITVTFAPSGVVSSSGSPPTQGASSQSQTSSGSLLSTGSLFSFDMLTSQLGAQEQGTVATTSSSGGAIGTPGQPVAAISPVFTTLDQLINLASGSIPGVINTLVQVAQVQISDLVPLDDSVTETVAVLLVVSRGSVDASQGADDELFEDAGHPVAAATDLVLSRERLADARESNLERFLSDIAGALDDVPRDVLVEAGRQVDAWPKWVLRPTPPGLSVVSVDTAAKSDRSAAIPAPGPAPTAATERSSAVDVALSDLRGLDWESPQPVAATEAYSGRSGLAQLFRGILVVSSIWLGWTAAAGKRKDEPRGCPTG